MTKEKEIIEELEALKEELEDLAFCAMYDQDVNEHDFDRGRGIGKNDGIHVCIEKLDILINKIKT